MNQWMNISVTEPGIKNTLKIYPSTTPIESDDNDAYLKVKSKCIFQTVTFPVHICYTPLQ